MLMDKKVPRDLGEQPIAGIMLERGLKQRDIVRASAEQITHKMVSRAARGRRLTRNVQTKLLNALNGAAGTGYKLEDLFNY